MALLDDGYGIIQGSPEFIQKHCELTQIMARFGNAEYSKEFWENVNKHRKEECLKYQTDERNLQLAILQNKDKVFGPLIGD
jgi:hypothetical protein